MLEETYTDPPSRTLNVFYQGTNVIGSKMLEETYTKFKKYILPKQKRQNPDFQQRY